MIRLIIFDLDGTLAESKSSLDPETSELLHRLLGIVKVAVISGGDWPQFEKQLLSGLPDDGRLRNLSLLPTCGTKFFRYAGEWAKAYSEDLTPGERQKIVSALERALGVAGFAPEKTWGEVIEDRGSQITLSALGQQAPLEEKKKWDPDFAKRRAIKAVLDGLIPEFSVRMGGATSIDVTKPGIDKAYGVRKLQDLLGIWLQEMIFIGDALFVGGNDYPAEEAGVVSIPVRGPDETKRVIEAIIACLGPGTTEKLALGERLRYPPPSFEHLLQLSDATGVYEHAKGTAARKAGGYCTDDVARALVVVLREPSSSPELRRLEAVYVDFLVRAQLPDGSFHNRLSAQPECRWLDEVGSDGAIGRALWALGTAAAHGTTPGLRQSALASFEAGACFDSPSPRANAAAVLGAVELLGARPEHRPAQALLEAATARLGTVSPDPHWPWPEARLAYENARLAEGRIAAGVALGDERLLGEGLRLLDWLVETEARGNHFSFTPTTGWGRGEPRPGFDQQPIEAGAMADACARAFEVTSDERWARACLRAAAWFLGRNDVGVPLLDAATGGCRDGLEPDGCNENEGAESTLALLSALQHARRLQAAPRNAARTSPASTVAAPT